VVLNKECWPWPRWKPHGATVNSTLGVGIMHCRSEPCRNQLARPHDFGTGAPTGERQAFFRFSERVAAAGRVCKAFGPRVLTVLWNLVIGSCFFSDRTSLAAGNRYGHWSTPRSQVKLMLTSIEE